MQASTIILHSKPSCIELTLKFADGKCKMDLPRRKYQPVGWTPFRQFFKKRFRIILGLSLNFGVNAVAYSDQIVLIKQKCSCSESMENF